MPDDGESTIEDSAAGMETGGSYDDSEISQIDQLTDDFYHQTGPEAQTDAKIPEIKDEEPGPNRDEPQDDRSKESERAFTFNSLEEVAQAVNNEGWTKTYASEGGDVLQREEQGRAWMFKDGDGGKSVMTPAEGTEDASRHGQILEGLYTQGFAVVEFTHPNGEASVRQVFFADEKGNISYEIYNSAKEPVVEEAGIKVEDPYDDQQDPLPYRILRKEGETTEEAADAATDSLKETKAEAAGEDQLIVYSPEAAPQPIEIAYSYDEDEAPVKASLPAVSYVKVESISTQQELMTEQTGLQENDAPIGHIGPNIISEVKTFEVQYFSEAISIESEKADAKPEIVVKDIEAVASEIEGNISTEVAEQAAKPAENKETGTATDMEARDGIYEETIDDLEPEGAGPQTITARSIAQEPRENAQATSRPLETSGITLSQNLIIEDVGTNAVKFSAETVENANVNPAENPIDIVLDIQEDAEAEAEQPEQTAIEIIETDVQMQEESDTIAVMEAEDGSPEAVLKQETSIFEKVLDASEITLKEAQEAAVGIEITAESIVGIQAEEADTATVADTLKQEIQETPIVEAASETGEKDAQMGSVTNTNMETAGIALTEEEEKPAVREEKIEAAIKVVRAEPLRPEPATRQTRADETRKVEVKAAVMSRSKEPLAREIELKAIDIEAKQDINEQASQPVAEKTATVTRQIKTRTTEVLQRVREINAQRNESRTIPVVSGNTISGQRQPVPQRAARQQETQPVVIRPAQRPAPASGSNEFVSRMLNYRPAIVADDEEITANDLPGYTPELELAA